MQSNECARNCWIAAAVIGLLVWIFTSFIGETSVMGGLFLGLMAGVLMGFFLNWALCRGAGSPEDGMAQQSVADARAVTPSPMRVSGASTGGSAAASMPREEEQNMRRKAAEAEVKAIKSEAADRSVKPAKEQASKPKAKTETPKQASEPEAKPEKPKAGKAPEPKAEKPAKSGDDASAAKPKSTAKSKAKVEPDDLKQIKGVGPKLEQVLHENGVTRFEQIAAWGEAEIDDMAEKIGSMGGRIRSDDWVDQARTLAAGGSTEFSKRVDKGDVY